MAKSKFYVVWKGHNSGIYTDWPSCKKQVDGFAGAKYKSYPTREEAEEAYSNGAATKSNKSSSSGRAAAKTTGKPANRTGVKTWSASDITTLTSDTLIYTDGGCEPNPGEAGSGMAIYRDGKVDELWYGLYNPNGTNNTAELNALYQALVLANNETKNGRSVAILCDSKYSIQCVTQWAVNWEKKGWTRPGGEIKNLELIKELYSLHQTLKDKIQILHVNGHVGVEGNELADRMSILAIEENNAEFSRYPDKIDIDEILALRRG